MHLKSYWPLLALLLPLGWPLPTTNAEERLWQPVDLIADPPSISAGGQVKQAPDPRQAEADRLSKEAFEQYQRNDWRAALATWQAALAMYRELGDRAGEAGTLSNLGFLFEVQDNPVLAIIFLKQAINTYGAIRDSDRALTQELREAYTATVEDHYRRLAELLLGQDRILEAQRVLDLLRVQELDTYVLGVRGNQDNQAGVPLRPDERAVVEIYADSQEELIALGRERAELAQVPPLEQALPLRFQELFERPDIVELINRLRTTVGAANIELPELNALRDNLQKLEQTAVVLYPLVLPDWVELVLVTPDSPPIYETVPVERTELNRLIGQLRYALEAPGRDAKPPAGRIYDSSPLLGSVCVNW